MVLIKLPITIEKDSGIPIYLQLGEQIRLLLRRGVLGPGDPMPTTRALAVELGINANTVTRVYRELQNEKVLTLLRGKGTFVSESNPTLPVKQKDFRKIERVADQLIALCQESRMLPVELFQLLKTRWDERGDVSDTS